MTWQPVGTATLPSRAEQPLLDLAAKVHRFARFSLGPASEARKLAAEIHDTLPRVLAIMRDQEPGQPGAQSYDGDRVKGGGGSDRTATVALAGDHRLPDDRKAIDVGLRKALAALTEGRPKQARTALDGVARVLSSYGSRPASSLDRRKAHEANWRNMEPGCEPCSRLPGHEQGVGLWVEVERETTCGGILPEKLRLCWWHRRWTHNLGRLPTDAEALAHHRDGKNPRQRLT